MTAHTIFHPKTVWTSGILAEECQQPNKQEEPDYNLL